MDFNAYSACVRNFAHALYVVLFTKMMYMPEGIEPVEVVKMAVCIYIMTEWRAVISMMGSSECRQIDEKMIRNIAEEASSLIGVGEQSNILAKLMTMHARGYLQYNGLVDDPENPHPLITTLMTILKPFVEKAIGRVLTTNSTVYCDIASNPASETSIPEVGEEEVVATEGGKTSAEEERVSIASADEEQKPELVVAAEGEPQKSVKDFAKSIYEQIMPSRLMEKQEFLQPFPWAIVYYVPMMAVFTWDDMNDDAQKEVEGWIDYINEIKFFKLANLYIDANKNRVCFYVLANKNPIAKDGHSLAKWVKRGDLKLVNMVLENNGEINVKNWTRVWSFEKNTRCDEQFAPPPKPTIADVMVVVR